MFDIGFLEIATVAVVALVVFGPKRLPTLAKTVGNLVAKSRRLWQQAQDDINQSIHGEDKPKDEHPKT